MRKQPRCTNSLKVAKFTEVQEITECEKLWHAPAE